MFNKILLATALSSAVVFSANALPKSTGGLVTTGTGSVGATLPPTAPATTSSQVQCPVQGSQAAQTKAGMYAMMEPGSGSNSADNERIVFLGRGDKGNRSMISQYTGINADFFADTGNTSAFDARFSHSGIFKITYGGRAHQCRRQIILMNKNADDSWNGYTAVEICRLDLIQLFQAAKSKGAAKSIESVVAFADKIGKSSPDLEALIPNATQEPHVEYFRDEDGDVLPRFAVRLLKAKYTKEAGNCVLNINHANAMNYAGLISSGDPWDYNFKLSDGELFEAKRPVHFLEGTADNPITTPYTDY